MSESSPAQWKHPDDVMKLLKVKKRALHSRMNRSVLGAVKHTNSSLVQPGSLKRKNENPFRFSPLKKARINISAADTEWSSDTALFHLINKTEKTEVKTSQKQLLTSFLGVSTLLHNNQVKPEEPRTAAIVNDHVSIDWSLKSKARFVSSQQFPWSSNLKTVEEASGLTCFSRCIVETCPSIGLDTSLGSQFHQTMCYWQHPSLPWINLFPRNHTRTASSKGNSMFVQDELKESLHHDWSESLRSAYALVRSRQCPYLYMLAPTFSCVFRASGVSGYDDIHAIISPTTQGFRKALKEDDIEFVMPLKEAETAPSAGVTGDAGSDDEETCVDFLNSIGSQSQHFPEIAGNRVQSNAIADCAPSSTVVISGGDCHALLNFFINCRSITLQTGPTAGVPPTLLSPSAFHGATLRTLKVKRNTLTGKDGCIQHSLEVVGPILPHTVQAMCYLLSSCMESYTGNVSTVDGTAQFNVQPSNKDSVAQTVFAKQSLSECGLPKDLIKRMCNCSPSTESIEPIHEIKCHNRKFLTT